MVTWGRRSLMVCAVSSFFLVGCGGGSGAGATKGVKPLEETKKELEATQLTPGEPGDGPKRPGDLPTGQGSLDPTGANGPGGAPNP